MNLRAAQSDPGGVNEQKEWKGCFLWVEWGFEREDLGFIADYTATFFLSEIAGCSDSTESGSTSVFISFLWDLEYLQRFLLVCSELSFLSAQQSESSHNFPFPSHLFHTFSLSFHLCNSSLWKQLACKSLKLHVIAAWSDMWAKCLFMNLLPSLSHFSLALCLCLCQLPSLLLSKDHFSVKPGFLSVYMQEIHNLNHKLSHPELPLFASTFPIFFLFFFLYGLTI